LPGSQYYKNGMLDVVRNAWRPAYKFTGSTDALSFSTPITNMSATAWTVEAYVFNTSTLNDTEQFFLDFRSSSSASGAGFAVGLGRYTNLTQVYFRPVVYSEGTTTQTGAAGATLRAASGPTNVHTNCWAHVAVVKSSADANNIYLYLNGASCGTVAIGTNYTSGATWAQVLLGKLVNYSTFKFYGTMAGLRVSNTALHTSAFTPPDTFTQSSSTTFLLWNGFKEKISGATLTLTGSPTYYNESGSALPFQVL
jgi:hypothetical protein